MTRKTLLEELVKLSAAERLLLAQDLWDTVAADPEAVTLSPAQQQELARRFADLKDRIERGEAAGSAWSDVKTRIRRGA